MEVHIGPYRKRPRDRTLAFVNKVKGTLPFLKELR